MSHEKRGSKHKPPGGDTRGRQQPAELPARWAALHVLSELYVGGHNAREAIDRLIALGRLKPDETGLATELVMGVVRHRLTLAKMLGTYAVNGWQRVSRNLQNILMIGAYQIVWLDGIPPFAAVNEAVNQGRSGGGTKAGNFVNAILRQLLRDIEHQRICSDKADPVRAIPVSDRECLQLKHAVLTDPGVNPTAYLAEASSHPTWLVGRWIDHFGRAKAEAICRAGVQRPATMLRPNRLRIEAGELAARLREEGFEAELTPGGQIVVTGGTAGLMRGPAFEDGLFQPQDPTSAKPVLQMKLAAGQVVLDLCAGAGTKTSQMAEIMGNNGLILASDKEGWRLEQLQTNARRLGISIVQLVAGNAVPEAVAGLKRLDWILIDAPCSNTGVLARRPEARYRVDGKSLEGLAAVQAGLLDMAAGLARPNTRIMYSTCSLEPEENEEVATTFANGHPDWTMIGSELTLPLTDGLPSSWHDGGYWSAWVRK